MISKTERFHGLDAVRGIAMLLGIVLHASLPYIEGLPKGLWPSDKNTSNIIPIIFEFIHIWRMPIFFIISGFFANLVITRKSLIIWWKNRFLRLVLPAMIFFPIMSLTIPWIFMYGYTGNINFFFSNEGQPHHLWFLYHLFIFVLFSIFIKFFGLIIYKFFKQINLIVVVDIFNTVKSFLGRHIFDSRFPILMIFVFFIFNLFTGADLIINPLASGLYFLFGYRLYKNNLLFDFIKSNWKFYLIGGLTVTIIFFILNTQASNFAKEDVRWIPWVILKISSAVLLSFSFIGLAEQKFSNLNPIVRFISDSSYWVYLIHLPLVAFITFFMFKITIFAELKFLIAIILTSAICLVTYKYFVRSTIIGILLNGKKLGSK
tara:strand:+ start:1059 stop:2183 length:1125 start_codon:yes stop_codon:yes gene_type:complete